MKPENTDSGLKKQLKREARRGLLINELFLLPMNVFALYVVFFTNVSGLIRILLLFIILGSVVGSVLSVFALKQRYREIEVGEELEAKKY